MIIPFVLIIYGVKYKTIAKNLYKERKNASKEYNSEINLYFENNIKANILLLFGLSLITLILINNFIFDAFSRVPRFIIFTIFLGAFVGSKLYYKLRIKQKMIF